MVTAVPLGAGVALKEMVSVVSRLTAAAEPDGSEQLTNSAFPLCVAVRAALKARPAESDCATRNPASTRTIAAERVTSFGERGV